MIDAAITDYMEFAADEDVIVCITVDGENKCCIGRYIGPHEYRVNEYETCVEPLFYIPDESFPVGHHDHMTVKPIQRVRNPI